MRPSFGVQLWSVRDAFAQDPLAALTRLRDIGFRSVEVFQLLDNVDTVASIRETVDVDVPSAHEHLRYVDPVEAFRAARRLGARAIVDISIPEGIERDPDNDWVRTTPELWRSKEGIAEEAHRLNALAERAAPFGLDVGIHNHNWEVEVDFDGRTGLEVLSEHLDDRVFLQLDVFWAALSLSPERVPDLIRRLGSRVRSLHLKDGNLPADFATQVPVGRGGLPMEEILVAAASASTAFLEFDEYEGDPFVGLEEGLRWLESPR